MEVGAVKQAFNNEVILLKKNLNQAKIQTIHKLTRKAKTLTEKKAPEQLKEKLKRKAESAVNEVLILKKIKAKDIAKFIVTHTGQLNDYLNRPKVDQEKACARLLLHKAMQDKYKFIRDRFSNVPIKDLFMSRLERRKIKKEAKEKQKNKKKSSVVNSEGDWNVEDLEMDNEKKLDDNESGDEVNENDVSCDDDVDSEIEGDNMQNDNDDGSDDEKEDESESEESSNNEVPDVSKFAKAEENKSLVSIIDIEKEDENISRNKQKLNVKSNSIIKKSVIPKFNGDKETNNNFVKINNLKQKESKKNPEKKLRDASKKQHFNEKLLQKKLKSSEAPAVENKIADPFFITSTGENYMSVVEPRQPDEVKEVHKQGNRKLRRAVMFGHVPKIKPRKENYRQDNFDGQNNFEKGGNFKSKFSNKNNYNDDRRSTFNEFKEQKEEKLHPSWEAKKKKSGILPFEGKKIVFNDS